jgi:hypothetical protein
MKIRLYPLVATIILIISVLVIGLRGTNPQTTAYQVGGLQTAASIQGVGLGPVLWSNNFTDTVWQLLSSNITKTSFAQNQLLDLNVTFTSQPIAQDVAASRGLNLPLDTNPVVVIQLDVSQGVYYGIRFSGVTTDGTTFNAWSENTPLQHRPGLGSPENVSANLQDETYLASGQPPVHGYTITRLWLYVEATAGTSGTFSMKVSSIHAFSLIRTISGTAEVAGNFQGIIINLKKLPLPNESIFQAYVDFAIKGSSTLRYTPFLMDGTIVLAQGFTYVQNSVTPYESAVLATTLISSFPNFLPDENSTAIIIGANTGDINQFNLVNISLKYTSTPIQSNGFIDPNVARFMLVYYFLFLFVTPIAAVILISRVFKAES